MRDQPLSSILFTFIQSVGDIQIVEFFKTPFADVFLVATGNSDRHVRSIADAVSEAASQMGEPAQGVEGYEDARWVLLDLGDVIVHVFQPDVREHYDLERLWSDAPQLDVGLPDTDPDGGSAE